MAKLTAIALWFDDGTRFDVDPDQIRSIFTAQSAAGKCGHHGPYETPGPNTPVRGPFQDSNPTHGGGGAGGGGANADATALSGGCYWVNGTIICP